MKKLLTFAAVALFTSTAFSATNFATITGYDLHGAWDQDSSYTGTETPTWQLLPTGSNDTLSYTGGKGLLTNGDTTIGQNILIGDPSTSITIFLDDFYSIDKIFLFTPDGTINSLGNLTINNSGFFMSSITDNLASIDPSYNLYTGTHTPFLPVDQVTLSDFSADSYFLTLSEIQISVSVVPEPSTYALMLGGLGLIGFMAARRRRLV